MENEFKRKAVCIKSADSGDSDRIVTLMTLEEGKIKAKMKGVKKAKAKLSFASFPFCFGEYLWVKRGNFCTITNCNFIDNFSPLLADMNLYYAGCSMLEIVDIVTKDNQENDGLFLVLIKSLNALAYGKESNVFAVLAKFLYEVLKNIGYGVMCDDSSGDLFDWKEKKQVFFDFESGVVSSYKTEGGLTLSEKEAGAFVELCTKEFSEFDMTQSVPKNVIKILVQFFEVRVDEALRIIKQFF